MVKEFQEGTVEVSSDALDEELRGLVIDDDRTLQQRLWMGGGFLTLLLIVAASWGYIYFHRTPEQLLAERLKDRVQVAQMLREASRTLRLPQVSTRQLKDSLQTVADVASTTLRQGGQPQNPYIPERHLALIDALESLMRMELEKILHPNNTRDRAFYDAILFRLGSLDLEYHEKGMLETLPLSLATQLKIELEREKTNLVGDLSAHTIVQELQEKIAAAEKLESGTIAGFALRLGKWFRYHNEIAHAERCFEIGRKYNEGYYRNGKFYEGKRPMILNPQWKEYVECLEALSDRKIQLGQYREARSFLARSFNTPQGTSLLSRQRLNQKRRKEREWLAALESDITTLERALMDPLALPSFPFYTSDSIQVEWPSLFAQIRREQHDPSTIGGQIWNGLSPDLQELVLSGEESLPLKNGVVERLNGLIQDPHFLSEVKAPQNLPDPILALQVQSEERELSQPDLLHLNRSALDLLLSEILSPPFVLTNGKYIHNGLNAQQTASLIAFYEEHIADPQTDAQSAQLLQQRVASIFQNRYHPTLRELHTEIQTLIDVEQVELDLLETQLGQASGELQQVRQDMVALEQSGSVDFTYLNTLRKSEENALLKRSEAQAAKEESTQRVLELQGALATIDKPIKRRLKRLKAELHSWELEQLAYTDPEAYTAPMLPQIDKQIDLRESYLALLKGLHSDTHQKKIHSLYAAKKQLEEQSHYLREKLSQKSGHEKKDLLIEIDQIEEDKHALLQDLNTLFQPLREVVEKIAKEETGIWETTQRLMDSREQIRKLLGTPNHPGSLQSKTQKRSELILARSTSDHPVIMFDGEIDELNRQIEEENLKLSLLLEKEASALNYLSAFYPHTLGQNTYFIEGGDLAPLQTYLEHQEKVMKEYQALWKRQQLCKNIAHQEELILLKLDQISKSLHSEKLSERQTQDLSRYMDTIVGAKRQLEESQRKLAFLEGPDQQWDTYSESESRGYELDTLALFQMEQKLGLKLSEYRAAFEDRKNLSDQIHRALREKKRLDEQKLAASRRRDQIAIDALIPRLTFSEAHITDLTKRTQEIDSKLQLLSQDYSQSIQKMHAYRQTLSPKTSRMGEELAHLHSRLSESNKRLQQLSESLMLSGLEIDQQVTQLKVEDLGNIQALISVQEEELAHLKKVRTLQHEENFYKARALWRIGDTLYQQSQLPSYQELLSSNTLPYELKIDEEMHGVLAFDEYNPKHVYTDQFSKDTESQNSIRANYEIWLDYLESAALELFLNELPKYTTNPSAAPQWLVKGELGHTAEINAFIAKSRFLSGKIHAKRAIRFLRSNRHDAEANVTARKEINEATDSFIRFLDFAGPLEAHENAVYLLSEQERLAQEFPDPSRKPIRLVSDARVYLGTLASLKGDENQAIEHFRQIINDMSREIFLNSDRSLTEKELVQHTNDPLLETTPTAQLTLHPLYASLLSSVPIAHEAVYRMGRSYQKLSQEESQLAIEESEYYLDRAKEHEARSREYAEKAVSYYSQMIQVQGYSPYRRASQLQRALLTKKLGRPHEARQDLVSILGSPQDEGGSWSYQDLTEKGDLPGELQPGYSHIAFELGKLYLETGDYIAAADAFLKAKEGDPKNRYVFQAKIAYAQTLTKSKKWLMAHLFLTELVSERSRIKEEREHLVHADLLIDLGLVNQALGNYKEAIHTFEKIFHFAPAQMVQNGEIDLSQSYGMAMLQEDYRDAIRPLALACLNIGHVALLQRDFSLAQKSFQKAETLFRLLPWQEDRVLREKSREEFETYRESHQLAARWGQQKTHCTELLFSTFGGYRGEIHLVRRNSLQLNTRELVGKLDDVLSEAKGQRESFREISQELQEFYEKENSRIPETREWQQVELRRIQDRRKGGFLSLRYDGLKNLREQMLEHSELEGLRLGHYLLEYFNRESLEDQLINEFIIGYVRDIDFPEEERQVMREGKGSLENLLKIMQAEEELALFRDRLLLWTESEMRLTGLDDQFIPLSEQAKTLEEVNLYRVATLAHLDDPESYEELTSIADGYLEMIQLSTRKVSRPELLWQICEIASTTAEYQGDWQKVVQYNRFLLQEGYQHFFVAKDQSDRLRAEMALAKGLLQIAEESRADIAFLFDEEEKIARAEQAKLWISEAQEILTRLTQLPSKETLVLATKTMAKELLQKI